jgi:organic hydroperoxide reductase OsmC/OhrA
MQVDVHLRNLPGTEAAVGWAGGHTIVADRPDGKAGGQGLGFSGAQMLALALGGCFCNDLRYVAETLGVMLDEIAVDVLLELEGDPLVATSARMSVVCSTLDGSDPAEVIDQAKKSCMVSNSLSRGVPVTIERSV